MARLELFRLPERDQAWPADRAARRSTEDQCLGSAHRDLLGARPRQGQERDAAAGRAGVAWRWRWAALVGAILPCGLRHVGGDRNLGPVVRRPPPASVDHGARWPDRVGDAIV